MHSADRSTAGGSLNVFIEHFVGDLCILNCRTSTVQFSRRAYEDSSCGTTPALVRSTSHWLAALTSFWGVSKTMNSGGGPLNVETVPLRSSLLPSTSDTSGPSSRS